MSVLILSRRNLVRKIDSSTPFVVLQEISQCHKILIDENFSENFKHKPIGIVHSPPREEDWELVAQYVNPNVVWTMSKLEEAYEWLTKWTQRIPTLAIDFQYGLQTNETPLNVNACMLYKVCKEYRLPVNRETSLHQLATIVKMYIGNLAFAQTIVANATTHLDKLGLIQVYLAAAKQESFFNERETNSEFATFKSISESASRFSDKNLLRLIIQPRTKSEAIVLGAMNYHIDLFYAGDPVKEYQLLQNDPSAYFPQDTHLLTYITGNVSLLNLRETFNPMLPPDLYDENILVGLAKMEGYTNTDLQEESPYTLLQTISFSNTFYHGRHPHITNKKTPFLYELIEELHDDLVICYGCLANKTMIAFSYMELTELFRYYKNFMNPLENAPFPDIAISKLKNLCKRFKLSDTDQIHHEKLSLFTAIINTEIFIDQTQYLIKDFYLVFESSNANVKQKICEAILSLFHLAMYMRGWLGVGEYPIERAPVEEQLAIDIKVTQEIITFEQKCNELDLIGKAILDLPLLRYRNNSFYRVTDSDLGRTIGERLEITKNGENHSTFDSCIRLSSNYFAATSYRYMQLVGISTPFDIDKLREIS